MNINYNIMTGVHSHSIDSPNWYIEGYRPCPFSKNGIINGDNGFECSQPVLKCKICGEYDYGSIACELYCKDCEHKKNI